ncbi:MULTISPECIES: tail fiber assembly protein [Enterobacteriaceae]|uniref:Tail fiber assembly protein n=1 Tax=Cronobacter sakazakii TaxID=28141 RepID=A0A853H6G4_CROSK|nr:MULTISPECIES: tail fiber assembly protein [Enterobacteriaceae]EFH3036732.1 tail fiber assembly protein [Escherichia coli]EFH6008024.1 tail fiber assembly protein [Escherichia coli]EFM0018537.1 tail fiber assembly protein [Escherichia coli]EHP6177208.1 tail fiber assembly protein [Escherichia coli]EKJ4548757.1 tail fiber assembly protein [Escherichia coli]
MVPESYAVVNSDGLIINIVVWDGVTEWGPPEGTHAVRCGDNLCGIGGTYKEGVFNVPPEPEVPKEDLISQAEQQKANLIAEASQTISILQDAVDLDMATDEERTQLTTLKKYRVLLSRVDTSKAPDIDWPK